MARRLLPTSSFEKSQTRKKTKRKTTATAKKMKMTKPKRKTTATRSEHVPQPRASRSPSKPWLGTPYAAWILAESHRFGMD
jgi:hypothetical protein